MQSTSHEQYSLPRISINIYEKLHDIWITGCDPQHGYCNMPEECRCRLGTLAKYCQFRGHTVSVIPFIHDNGIHLHYRAKYLTLKGFAGELCDRCALLPGCHHGTCNKSFECTCQPGWDGLFCTQGTVYMYRVQGTGHRVQYCIYVWIFYADTMTVFKSYLQRRMPQYSRFLWDTWRVQVTFFNYTK